MASYIEDYALIGDCETAALVSKSGSIDWLCWPDFASGACFASLLGDEENGFWRIAPGDSKRFTSNEHWTISRKYVDDSLVLSTIFDHGSGAIELCDFMPMRSGHSHLVRLVTGLRGIVPMRMELAVRFGYGQIVPWVTRNTDGGICCIGGPDMVVLRSPVETRGEGRRTVAEFHVKAGESYAFTLSYGPSAGPEPNAIDVHKSLEQTRKSWTSWAAKTTDAGKYTAAVRRSLITLRAMSFRPTGGVVAAATTSLPESLGGSRNWDYRYCWLRDSTFTLLALMNGGYFQEAEAWGDWLLRAIAGSAEQIQIMYGIRGERHLMEWEVPWLSGYEKSSPVRIGNAAAEQLQLDIYGEVMDAFYHLLEGVKRQRPHDFDLQRALMDHLTEIWQKPDQGIWESRSGAQQFTYSKMMAWVAFDRAIQIAEAIGKIAEDAPVEQWRATRQRIHEDICAKAYNKKLGAFTQIYGSDKLDSSLLLMPLVGFLPASDPRVRGTIEAIEKHLMRDGLLMRYNTSNSADGLPPGEGAFLACSFWLVSCLKMLGRVTEARALFERLLSLCNDVGLLSEEYDVEQKRQVGNFPQAFSHIALVNAAFELEQPQATHRRHRGAHHHASPDEISAELASLPGSGIS